MNSYIMSPLQLWLTNLFITIKNNRDKAYKVFDAPIIRVEKSDAFADRLIAAKNKGHQMNPSTTIYNKETLIDYQCSECHLFVSHFGKVESEADSCECDKLAKRARQARLRGHDMHLVEVGEGRKVWRCRQCYGVLNSNEAREYKTVPVDMRDCVRYT